MAVTTVVECPECHKKFKGKPELEGKTVRCPGCQKSFTVRFTATDAPGGKSAQAQQQAPAPAGAAKKPMWDEEDNDSNPYGVTTLDLTPRCPHCAGALLTEEDVICLHCGYNRLTRQLGATKKTVEHTGGERFFWLLPGLACVFGILVFINADIFYCLVLPGMVKDSWLEFTDHESMRMWTVIPSLFSVWGLGMFAFKRLILEPVPPEKVKD
jgi:hypothetical protein